VKKKRERLTGLACATGHAPRDTISASPVRMPRILLDKVTASAVMWENRKRTKSSRGPNFDERLVRNLQAFARNSRFT